MSTNMIRKSPCNGFTLVEIMITVAIIGLLAAFAIPNYVKSRAAAQVNTCMSNLRHIDNAIQQFASEAHKPANSAVTEADVTPFLKSRISCPAGGTTFSDSYSVTYCNELPTCKSPGGGSAAGHVLTP
jgi:prepilin-type N-terminal cleavage/methylation domain-containing protein